MKTKKNMICIYTVAYTILKSNKNENKMMYSDSVW